MSIYDISGLEERGRTITAHTYSEAQEKLEADETLFILYMDNAMQKADPAFNEGDWDVIHDCEQHGLYYNLRLLAVKDLR